MRIIGFKHIQDSRAIHSLFSGRMLHRALEAHQSAYAGRTVCVTGGAGFIGSHIADTLVECGATVRILDDFSNGRESNLAGAASAAKVVRGSICDDAALDAAIAGA